MKYLTIGLLLGFIGAVAAEVATPPQTPQEKVNLMIAVELGRLRIDNVNLAVTVEHLQGELAKAHARVKELEAKLAGQK